MKSNMVFGLTAFLMLASMVSANAYTFGISDEQAYAEKLYVGTLGTLRYVGGPVDGFKTSGFVPYIAGSQAAAYQFYDMYSPVMQDFTPLDCPKTNGVPICA